MTAFARTHLFATGVLLASLVIGCGGSAASPLASGTESPGNNPPTIEAAFPRTLIDDVGDSVTINAEPQKIVALTPASLETLAELGLADRVGGPAQRSQAAQEALIRLVRPRHRAMALPSVAAQRIQTAVVPGPGECV